MSDFRLTESQALAVDLACKKQFLIITGGAGTGKTTVIKEIYNRLEQDGHNVCLTSPTGKASARITEATGYKAYTIHSACGLFPQDGDEKSPSSVSNIPPRAATATAFIVDEASMTDDWILAAIINTIPKHCKLILVGDPNQLPPVGAGYPFRDLINSGKVPTVKLDVCHRQNGSLLENCYKILRGEHDGLIYDAGKGKRADEDWAFISCSDEAILGGLTHIFTKGNDINAVGIPCEELLTITPLNKGQWGRIQLNRLIQKVYHESRGRATPEYNHVEQGYDRFVPGDRVIWTQNNKAKGLVNGDVGTVAITGDKNITVDFDGIGRVVVEAGPHLWLGWCLTCHKSQGSQYVKTLVVIADKHCNGYLDKIVNRSLVYTAATRSKKATYFLGSERAFIKHVQTPAIDSRNTYLETLLV